MAYQLKNKDGEAIQHDGKNMFASDFAGAVKGVNMDKRTLRILATDETRDRDGDVISMKGWDFENFIKNPVFLWSHDYSSVPLAAAIKIERKRSPARLVLTHKFPTAGVHKFADMILQLYKEKVINAGSVGFLPFDWEDIKEDDEAKQRGWSNRRFTKQELLEHSGCAVPANPNAVQDSIARAMKSMDFVYDDKVKLYKALTGEEKLELDDESKTAVEEELAKLMTEGPVFEEETAVQVQVKEDLLPHRRENSIVIYEESGEAEIYRDGEWTEIDANDLLQENYKGLKDLFEEIFAELIANSLAVELEDYRKRVDTLLKVGAVLNMKNKTLLKQASENILRVLKNAGDDSEAEGDNSTSQASAEADERNDETRFDAILNDETSGAEQNAVADGEVVKVKKVIPLKPRVTQQQVKEIGNSLLKIADSLALLSK